MNTEIEAAIKALTLKSHQTETKSHEALQWTQAALNLAHVAQVWKQTT
jgi:hypothetical protein